MNNTKENHIQTTFNFIEKICDCALEPPYKYKEILYWKFKGDCKNIYANSLQGLGLTSHHASWIVENCDIETYNDMYSVISDEDILQESFDAWQNKYKTDQRPIAKKFIQKIGI